MDMYIPINKAAVIAKLDKSVLQEMVASGNIRAIQTAEQILVNEKDLISSLPKKDRPEYKKHAHLAGVGILVSEASRKYDLTTPTISRWIQKGYISVLHKSSRRTYIDEADIAYLATLYHADPGQGKHTVRKS